MAKKPSATKKSTTAKKASAAKNFTKDKPSVFTPPVKRGRFTLAEEAYVKGHYEFKTDKELAEFLNRDPTAIKRKRDLLGLKKKSGGQTAKSIKDARQSFSEKQLDRDAYSLLTKEERQDLFRRSFESTERYKSLRRTLTNEEIDAYIENFLNYKYQFETLEVHEEDFLHQAIMQLIMQDRILCMEKSARDSFDTGDHNAMEIMSRIETLDRRYQESVEIYSKIMKSLHATREQRLKTNKETSLSLVTVVQSLQDEEMRKKLGVEAAMIKKGAELAKEVMEKEGLLLGG